MSSSFPPSGGNSNHAIADANSENLIEFTLVRDSVVSKVVPEERELLQVETHEETTQYHTHEERFPEEICDIQTIKTFL